MYVIGLMSGTAADGIDAALCEITGAPPDLRATVVHGATTPYPPPFRARLLAACDPATARVDEIARLNTEIAEQFALAARATADAAGVPLADVALIGSHGHTLWHDARPDGTIAASLQIGEGAVIAERTGVTTICNLRARDIAAGGQGAPLTSYVDWLLLRDTAHWRAVQNIGGMGNVTLLPPHTTTATPPVAFDTGPGNALIDAAVLHLTDGAQTYDHDGRIAAAGRVDAGWLAELLAHPYYRQPLPKTTGRETFGTAAALAMVATGRARGLPAADIVATLTALTAAAIADAYARYAPAPVASVVLGGGGAHNPALVAMLRARLPGVWVGNHEDVGMSTDFKEALVFAVLAYETWHGRPGALPALTGAAHPVLLGQLVPGRGWRP